MDARSNIPPWAQLAPEEWIGRLMQRMANLEQECAMKDAYIEKLHAALGSTLTQGQQSNGAAMQWEEVTDGVRG